MKILIIEDNAFKREKIVSHLNSIISDLIIGEADSYKAGLSKALNHNFDLLILDMSIPTFSKSVGESGGRIRPLGGKEIVNQIVRNNKGIPFIIVSQYSNFSGNLDMITLEEIGKEMAIKYPNFYIKTIFYDTTNIKWKEDLSSAIKNLHI